MTYPTSKLSSFELLTAINMQRLRFGYGPISKYEFPVRSELTAEYKRVMQAQELNVSPW